MFSSSSSKSRGKLTGSSEAGKILSVLENISVDPSAMVWYASESTYPCLLALMMELFTVGISLAGM